jgi:hypothetical protein
MITGMVLSEHTGGDERPDGESQDNPLPAFKTRSFGNLVKSPTVKRCNRGSECRHRLPDGCNEGLLGTFVPLNRYSQETWPEGGFGET